MNEHTAGANGHTRVNFLQMFRFVNATDLFFLLVGVCVCLLHSVCFVGHLVLFGQITGAFATQSFSNDCGEKNSTAYDQICRWSLHRSLANHTRLSQFCIDSDQSTLPMATFHNDIMNKIYWLLILGAIETLCTAMKYTLFNLVAARQTAHIRERLFAAVLQRNISFFDTTPAEQLNVDLFDNVDKLQIAMGFELSWLFTLLGIAVGSVGVALSISWKLTMLLLYVIPLIFFSTRLFATLTASETSKELASYAKADCIVQEVFGSLRTVLSLNGSQFEQQRYEQHLETSKWASLRKGAIFGTFFGWLYFICYLMYSTGFIAASLLRQYDGSDQLTISDILAVLIVFTQGVSLIVFSGSFLQTYAETSAAMAPIFRLIDQSALIKSSGALADSPCGESLADVAGDIQYDHVSFAYPARSNAIALRELTFTARQGQTTALVGLSGCGKSTALAMLLRFYEPMAGVITIGGRSIAQFDAQQWREQIGVVSQEPVLFSTSIYENIRYGKEGASQTEIEQAAQRANAHEFIMRLPNKYSTLVGERGTQLSGGEKQRIALARALVRQPTMLLLDEATSALDNASEKIVQEALDRACENCTTIVIAHRLTTIRKADWIYVMHDGRVVEEGSHVSLMANEGGRYHAMVNTQFFENIDDEEKKDPFVEPNAEQKSGTTEKRTEDVSKAPPTERTPTGPSVFLRLLSMNRPEWIAILIGCLACMAIGASQLVYAIFITAIVNAFENCDGVQHTQRVLMFSLLFLLLGVLVLIIRFVQLTAFSWSGSKLTQRIRSKAFGCLLRQDIAYFDVPENSSGAISSRLSSDAAAIQHMTGARLGIVAGTVVMLTFGFVLGSLFSWQLTCTALVLNLLVFVLVYMEIRLHAMLAEHTGVLAREASSLAVEVIHNMRTVKQLNIETIVLERYKELTDGVYRIRRKFMLVSSLLPSLYWSIGIFTIPALYAFALALIERGELPMRSGILVFSFVLFSTQAGQVATTMTKTIGATVPAARCFFRLFDRTPTIDNGATTGRELTNFTGQIEFNDITFAYPCRPTACIFDKLQLTVTGGQRVALVGASGCGKSTLIQLLERFYDVDHGRILLDGVDIRELNIHSVRSQLGLVSQEPVLFDLTIAENIAYSDENASMEDIISAATSANAHEFIQNLPCGYDTRVGKHGSQLSGGEKQRVAIARCLLRQPKILLLDEATSAMDSINEQIVQRALERAQTERAGRTTITIAHRLSTIRSHDWICVLDRGSLVESGTHAELMQRRGAYYRMQARDGL